MGVRVQKYGGTSVADTERLKVVAERVAAVRNEGHDVVVVVSAMGGTTDELLGLAHRVSADPDRRELDMLLSVGERISMTLLAIAVKDLGLDAVSFTGSQSGIITNDAHTGARIIDVRPYRIQDELARGRVVIVAGYQGVSYRKEVTTLGRGGSDTTAVALAAALGADVCEIWSDVDGVFSADPRVVVDARQLRELGYDEMQELARAGAKVLNADAVQFAREAGIELHARSTFAPDGRGTIVRRIDPPEERPRVVGVAGATDRRLLRGDAPDDARILLRLDGASLVAPGAKEICEGAAVGTVTIVCAMPEVVRPLATQALEASGIRPQGEALSIAGVTYVVSPDEVEEAVRRLHGALIDVEAGAGA